MTSGDSSSDSGIRHLRGRMMGGRFAAGWDPRRSIGARLAFVLVPLLLVPALFYWYASSALGNRTRENLAAILTRDAVSRERSNLRQAADRRAGRLEEEITEVLNAERAAAAQLVAALGERPANERSPERLEDVPHGPIRTVGRGASAAMIARSAGVTPVTLRDLAATRRLEGSLETLLSAHEGISAAFVLTKSGILRVVPWRDLSHLVSSGSMPADFRVPGRTLLGPGDDASWTAAYDDPSGGRDPILSALLPVRDAAGTLLGEVGIDWAFGEFFERVPEARRRGERELVFTREGQLLFQIPGGLSGTDTLFAQASRRGPGERELTVDGIPYLAAVRTVHASGWTFVRLVPLAAIRRSVEGELEPVFASTRTSRRSLQAVTLALLLLAVVALGVTARNATAPVRGLAIYADAITRRAAPGEAPGKNRTDEVGRLARALEDLDGRVRRRLQSMEGLHDLAATGAVMTRPDETYARLARRIAELVGASKAWFALWDAEARELVFTPPGFGISDERLAAIRISADQHSLAMLAFRTGETYVSNDLASDPRVLQSVARAVEVERNAVFVPLRTEAGSLGVMIVCDKPGPFDVEDQGAIQIYADEAALLLRNARLYEELQRSFERLRDAHRNRDYFLQNINHELRTPLTAILGWSEVLAEDKPDPPTVTMAVEQIRRSAQFLLTLISDLLDLSRFEEGRTQLDRAATDIGTLVREAIEPVAVMAEAKGIAISVTAPEPGVQNARLDPIRTRQVIWNLVHNAVKFTHKGGRIDVCASRDEKEVTFTVGDDGVGIDPKDLPFIFERFRQGDGSTTRAYRGTGIGLALAKAYAELHGGRIEAQNRPGSGALFRVFLPDPVSDSSGSLPRPKFQL